MQLRIFLSSPGDVAEERKLARDLILELQRRPLLKGRVSLEVVAYDDPDAPAPMSAVQSPQASVNQYSGQPADCDLTLVILWSRLGTPLPPGVARPDGTRYESGTVWELENARQAGKEVFLYWRTETPRVAMDDPDIVRKLEAYAGVNSFFQRFTNPDGSLAAGVSRYADPPELGRLLEKHLESFINSRLGAQQVAPEGPFEPLRRSARTILKLYGAKAVHDLLHEIYFRSDILRAEDLTHVDGRVIAKLASYCETKLVAIEAEAAECAPYLDEPERIRMKGLQPKFESGIARLGKAAESNDARERADAVDAFTGPLDAWLTQLDGCIKEMADRLDVEELHAAMASLKEQYAVELRNVERSLERLMAEDDPVFQKCRALSEEHHGLQYVHDELPGLINRVMANDPELAAAEWRALKRRLTRAREAWERLGQLPAGGTDWEGEVRDDGKEVWPLVSACVSELDGILTAAEPATGRSMRPLTRLRDRINRHFKLVDEALREGYRRVKEGVGRPIMEIGSMTQAVREPA